MNMPNVLFDGLFAPQLTSAKSFLITADNQEISYTAFLKETARLANALVNLGVAPGDRVAVQIKKSTRALALYVACVRCGAVFLPLNTAYTPSEIDYFVENAEPRLLVCDPKSLDALQAVASKGGAKLLSLDGKGEGSLWDAASALSDDFATVAQAGADLAAILYTSGTTGRSKGAMLSHDNLLTNAKALQESWRFSQDDVLLHMLPIFHTHGLFVACNVLALVGGKMIFLAAFNVDDVIARLPDATTMMGVPTFYTRLLSDDRFSRELTAHMRLFTSGSAPLLAETHIEFEQRTGHRILERYGMTETNMITSNPYDGERRAGTVGFALPGVQVRIRDGDSGKTVADGEIGVIEVKGPNVFKGYWRMPEKTKEEFRDDGFFITGDLAIVDSDGYVQIVGRAKDLIISGGYNIYPKEIELLLDEQEGVKESAVIGVPHPDFGEGVIGVLVASPGVSIDSEALMAAISEKIARFKQPKQLFVVKELPRNTMGKVQKNILRDKYSGTFTT